MRAQSLHCINTRVQRHKQNTTSQLQHSTVNAHSRSYGRGERLSQALPHGSFAQKTSLTAVWGRWPASSSRRGRVAPRRASGARRGPAVVAAAQRRPWRSSIARSVEGQGPRDWQAVLERAIRALDWPADVAPDMAVLTVPKALSPSLEAMSAEVAKRLKVPTLVGVVGAGAIGGGAELMDDYALSILAGVLPSETAVTPFVVTREQMPTWTQLAAGSGPRPSFLLFADPFAPVTQAVSCLDAAFPSSVVAGGLSCPVGQGGTVASRARESSVAVVAGGEPCRALPPGSLLGLCLRGPNLEVHTACAQGAAPVGPTFSVTQGQGNLVEALDGQPAVAALKALAQEVAEEGDRRTLQLIQRALLVGLPAASLEEAGAEAGEEGGEGPAAADEDFLIRVVQGASQDGGLYIGERVVPGRTRMRFHVRDEKAASDDLRLILEKYRLLRQFSGRFAAPEGSPRPVEPLATLLFSCNGRGTNMYSNPNHDTDTFAELVGSRGPVGGFFCNGEISPVGAGGLADPASADAPRLRTQLHGFTSVFAMLYDTEAAPADD